MEIAYAWKSEEICKFIRARSKFKFDASLTDFIYQQILHDIGLANFVSPAAASALWEWLTTKYKEICQLSLESRNAVAPWEYFTIMQEAMSSQPTSNVLQGLPSHSNETVEEEAARLEEVFRVSNITVLPNEDEEAIQSSAELFKNDGAVENEYSSVENLPTEDLDEDEEDLTEVTASSSLTYFSDQDRSNIITDDIWTENKILDFIKLRCEKGSNASPSDGQWKVYKEILDDLGLSDDVSVAQAKNKWSQLVIHYSKIKNKNNSSESHNVTVVNNINDEETVVGNNQNTSNIVLKPFFYSSMEVAMTTLSKVANGNLKTKRKSPEFTWSNEINRKFIKIRGEKHTDIYNKGHNAVYQEILEELGISDRISASNARKKWSYLVKKYQDEELAGGRSTWVLMNDMKTVMKRLGGTHATYIKSRASPEFLWPNDLTKKFIALRTARHADFVNGENQQIYMEIMEELNLGHILNVNQLRKKWNYLVAKYREFLCSGMDVSVSGPHSWPFFEDMKKSLALISTSRQTSTSPSRFNVKKNSENIWTKDLIFKLIESKGRLSAEDGAPGRKASVVFGQIVEELGLTDQITADQARRKWNYLYSKYINLSHPDVDEFGRHSWPFYGAMQEAVGTLSSSEIISKKNFGIEEEEIEGNSGRQIVASRRNRLYSCFLCGKTSRLLSEFFIFEEKQLLLHTQQNILAVLSDLIGKKLFNNGSKTSLCSQCTNLANEADSVIAHRRKIEKEAQKLYSEMLSNKNKTDYSETTFSSDAIEESDNAEEDLDIDEENPGDDQDFTLEDNEGRLKKVTYSKRGRKRTSIVSNSMERIFIKTERLDKDVIHSESADNYEPGRRVNKQQTLKNRRGRPSLRGKRKRGRPTVRSSLIGRGLEEQYPTSNKRKIIPLKGPKIYRCIECNSEFKKYTELVSHRKEVHTLVDQSTLEVKETILENGLITYFNKGKANNVSKSHPCRECDKRFLRKDDLWYHEEIAHTAGKGRVKTVFKDRSYECDECGEKFLFKYKLKMHVNNKHLNDAGLSADDFTCGVCGCKLGNLPGLTFHMRKHHNKSLTYQKTAEYLCNSCGFLAHSKKKLKDHQSSHCKTSSKPKVQCEICGKTVLKVSLKMHKMKMHLEFKEQCDRCGERYATKTDLLRHINIVHLKIFLFACDQCGEKFPTSDSLRYHRVKQHEKPSFYCQICGKCYRRVGELNSHIKRTHDDRKKAQVCHFCSKEYFDRSGLRNHLISKHNVPQEMTYSETHLRKIRVDGLPLSKHIEKRDRFQPTAIIVQSENQNNMDQAAFNNHPPPQHQLLHTTELHSSTGQNETIVSSLGTDQTHMRIIMEEAAEAARNLTATTFHEVQTVQPNQEDSGQALVVTEITAGPSQVEQAVLVDPINGVQQSTMMHHHHHHPQQINHMIPAQPTMQMVHHQNQHQVGNNMRLNLLFPANMQNHGQPHTHMNL